MHGSILLPKCDASLADGLSSSGICGRLGTNPKGDSLVRFWRNLKTSLSATTSALGSHTPFQDVMNVSTPCPLGPEQS